MRVKGKYSTSRLLRFAVDLILIVNILALLMLPVWLSAVYKDPGLLSQLERQTTQTVPDSTFQSAYPSDLPESSYPFYLVFLYISGLGTAWILFEGHLILKRIEKGQSFVAGQSGSFRRVAGAFGVLALAFAVKIFTYNTLLTMFCCVLFILLVLIAWILSEIFRQAFTFKSENELTI